jgi:hypothetical protein
MTISSKVPTEASFDADKPNEIMKTPLEIPSISLAHPSFHNPVYFHMSS